MLGRVKATRIWQDQHATAAVSGLVRDLNHHNPLFSSLARITLTDWTEKLHSFLHPLSFPGSQHPYIAHHRSLPSAWIVAQHLSTLSLLTSSLPTKAISHRATYPLYPSSKIAESLLHRSPTTQFAFTNETDAGFCRIGVSGTTLALSPSTSTHTVAALLRSTTSTPSPNGSGLSLWTHWW